MNMTNKEVKPMLLIIHVKALCNFVCMFNIFRFEFPEIIFIILSSFHTEKSLNVYLVLDA